MTNKRIEKRGCAALLSIAAAILAALAATAPGQESDAPRHYGANFEQANRFGSDRLQALLFDQRLLPRWTGDGESFWYGFRTSGGTDYFFVDPEAGQKVELFGRADLTRALVRAGVRAQELRYAVVESIAQRPDGRFAVMSAGRELIFDGETGAFEHVGESSGSKAPPWLTTSPDGARGVFVRDYNLVLAETENPEQEQQLTLDGQCCYGFGSGDYYYQDDHLLADGRPRRADVLWSPDSTRFALIRMDARHIPDWHVADSMGQPLPSRSTYKLATPGGPVQRFEIWLYDHAEGRIRQVETQRWPDQTYENMTWSADSSTLYVCRRCRDQMKVDLLAIDAETARTRVLIEEHMEALVLTKPLFELPDGDGFLWFSRRDGWGHLYHYDFQGALIRQVTAGEFTVDSALALDAEEESLFFTACGREGGRNPYDRYLYRVGLDGAGLQLLTGEDADHQVALSPSRRWIVDSYARPDAVPRAVLRGADGREALGLAESDYSRFTAAGCSLPERFSAPAADGQTELWGYMWKPFDFDPGRRYPIVTFVYPGPQTEFIPRTFMESLHNSALAQMGLIVVQFGNRGGSWLRSLQYAEHGRGNMRDYGIDDKKAVLEELARRHEFIDIDRVGIWGSSSGGFMAVTAMLLYPEFFKVGVCRAGFHDARLLDRWWSEQFQGVEVSSGADGLPAYRARATPTSMELARRLQGHLLIVHGESDTTVPPSNTMRLVDALMASGKRFDLLIVPGGGHGWSNRWRYVQRRMWNHFAEHLLEARPRSADIFKP